MSGTAFRRLSALVIVTAVSGCDNVEWGGADIHLQPPPPARVGAPTDTTPTPEEQREALLPVGPVLYMGRRDSTGLSLVPVGEILEDSIAPFPSDDDVPGYRARFAREVLPQGSEFALFARGTRVGTFTVTSVETDPSFCVARPLLRGVAAWVPDAMAHDRFLALPRDAASHPWAPFAKVETSFDQRQASLTLAADVIGQVGADWSADILSSRWDLQALRPDDEDPPAFAVTYLLRDRMRIERPPPSAASLFILGIPRDGAYRADYVWYRQVAQEGKGAPMLFEQFDWDGDGEAEILLEVLGERNRWFAALDRRGGRWTRVYEDPCGASAPPVGAPT